MNISPTCHPDDYVVPGLTISSAERDSYTPSVGEDWELDPPEDEPLHPEQIDGLKSDSIRNVTFLEDGLLGEGAFGEVWKVEADLRVRGRRHSNRNKEPRWKRKRLACKLIRHEQITKYAIELSQNEIYVLKNLRHQNICNICDSILIPDRITGFPLAIITIFFELCNGNLIQIVKDFPNPNNCLSENLCKHFFIQVLRGLQYIHSKGVVHKDIKPDNILYKIDGNLLAADVHGQYSDQFLSSTFKLGDFGLAKFRELDSTSIRDDQKFDLNKLVQFSLVRYVSLPAARVFDQDYPRLGQFIDYCITGIWKSGYRQHWQSVSTDFKDMIKLSMARFGLKKLWRCQTESAEFFLKQPWLQNIDDKRTQRYKLPLNSTQRDIKVSSHSTHSSQHTTMTGHNISRQLN